MKLQYLKNITTLRLFQDKCTGCGMCSEVCPHAVFIINDKKAIITDKDSCMECGACMQNCPAGAIQVNTGVGCAAALIRGALTGSDPACGPSCGCS